MKAGYTLLLPLILAGVISCSKNHEVTFSDNILITNDLIGKWQVTEYIDSGIDKTSRLSSLSLQLNSSGGLLILYNDTTTTGTWAIVSEIGLDQLKLTTADAIAPYSDLQASWYVYDKTTSTLSLSNNSSTRSRSMKLQRI